MQHNIWKSWTETFTPSRFGDSGRKNLIFTSLRDSQRRFCSMDRISVGTSISNLRMPFHLRKLKSI